MEVSYTVFGKTEEPFKLCYFSLEKNEYIEMKHVQTCILRRAYDEYLLVGPYCTGRYHVKVAYSKLEGDGSSQNMQLSYKTPGHRILCTS